MLGMKLGIFPPDPGVRDSTTASARQGIIPPPQYEIAWRTHCIANEIRSGATTLKGWVPMNAVASKRASHA
jgi:hypothetical protein